MTAHSVFAGISVRCAVSDAAIVTVTGSRGWRPGLLIIGIRCPVYGA